MLGQLTQLRKSLCCHLSTISKFDSKLLHSCLESMQQSVIRWWEFFSYLIKHLFLRAQAIFVHLSELWKGNFMLYNKCNNLKLGDQYQSYNTLGNDPLSSNSPNTTLLRSDTWYLVYEEPYCGYWLAIPFRKFCHPL